MGGLELGCPSESAQVGGRPGVDTPTITSHRMWTMDEVALLSQGSFQRGLPKAPQRWEGLTPSAPRSGVWWHMSTATHRGCLWHLESQRRYSQGVKQTKTEEVAVILHLLPPSRLCLSPVPPSGQTGLEASEQENMRNRVCKGQPRGAKQEGQGMALRANGAGLGPVIHWLWATGGGGGRGTKGRFKEK